MNGFLAYVRIGLAVGVVAAGLFFNSSDLIGQSTGTNTTSSQSAKNDTKPAAVPDGVDILSDT